MNNQIIKAKRKIIVEDDVEQIDILSKPSRSIRVNVQDKKVSLRHTNKYNLNISHNGGLSLT